MQLQLWDAAIRDNRNELQELTDGLIERYESDQGPKAQGAKLKKFLPLLPALADPRNAKHGEAIGNFGNDPNWVILRWLWIEKFKLSKDDAITFLGGRETDAGRHAMVSYLEGDVEGTRAAVEALMHHTNIAQEQCVLARFLSMKLSKDVKEPVVADMKPKDAVSARAAVMARLTGQQK